MRRATVLAVAGLAVALSGPHASAESRSARDGEARLARMLGGHVAGEATSCIPTVNNSDQLIVIDGVGVVYDTHDALYVARVTEPEKLRWTDRIDFVRASHKVLCTSDAVWTFDRRTGLSTGALQLGEFVRYTRG